MHVSVYKCSNDAASLDFDISIGTPHFITKGKLALPIILSEVAGIVHIFRPVSPTTAGVGTEPTL